MKTSPRAVIIGAGLGGLATALRLAVRGWQVDIVERGGQPGGKMNRWQSEGFTFDTGPSLITMPEVFGELFQLAGTDITDHVELRRLDPVARYVYPSGLDFEYGGPLPALQREFDRCFPGEWSGFLDMMALGGRLFELSRQTFFAQAPGEPPSPRMLGALRSVPVKYGWGGYHATVRRFLRHPALIQFFDRFPTYVGSSPYLVPATLLAIPYLEYGHGAWHVSGGLYNLVAALAALLKARGARLHLFAEAQQIHISSRKVTAVELTDGRRLDADVAVFNGDASHLPLLAKDAGLPAPTGQRSLSGFVLLLGLRRKLAEQHHHTVYFSSNYRREFDELFGANGCQPQFPTDPTVYVNAPSRSDHALAPSAGETLFVMANAPSLGVRWDDEMTDVARRRVLARLATGGLELAPEDIVVERAWTPAEFEKAYSMPGGAIYGQASHGWRGAFLRPANRERRVGGLYRVGGSSHPGGGTPTVLLSARIVDRLISRYERP